MKKEIIFLVTMLILFTAGCTHNSNTESKIPENIGSINQPQMENNDNMVGMMDSPNHMGCQENEVGADGKCVLVSSENNANIFDKDFEGMVKGQEIVTDNVRGYMAAPVEMGDYPGIIMIHEWWGLNDNIRYMARLLASEGYRVFAVDLYDGVAAIESDLAGLLAKQVRDKPEEAVEKMKYAMEYIQAEGTNGMYGSIGWCFGGQQSLNLSLDTTLQATVIYYGTLTDDIAKLKNIGGPVLGIFGSEDKGIPPTSVNAFESALNTVGIENNITIYPGVGHAFANPSGSNYAKDETIDAWNKTVKFLNETLKKN